MTCSPFPHRFRAIAEFMERLFEAKLKQREREKQLMDNVAHDLVEAVRTVQEETEMMSKAHEAAYSVLVQALGSSNPVPVIAEQVRELEAFIAAQEVRNKQLGDASLKLHQEMLDKDDLIRDLQVTRTRLETARSQADEALLTVMACTKEMQQVMRRHRQQFSDRVCSLLNARGIDDAEKKGKALEELDAAIQFIACQQRFVMHVCSELVGAIQIIEDSATELAQTGGEVDLIAAMQVLFQRRGRSSTWHVVRDALAEKLHNASELVLGHVELMPLQRVIVRCIKSPDQTPAIVEQAIQDAFDVAAHVTEEEEHEECERDDSEEEELLTVEEKHERRRAKLAGRVKASEDRRERSEARKREHAALQKQLKIPLTEVLHDLAAEYFIHGTQFDAAYRTLEQDLQSLLGKLRSWCLAFDSHFTLKPSE
jgi:hypothetical protein